MARPIEKREFIEKGVVEVVARKGLHATTIQDIAAAAKVSPGLLYRYWENRDALAAEVYRQHYDALVERILMRAAPTAGTWDQIDAIVREFLAFAEESPTILKFLLLSQHDLVQSMPTERGVRRLLATVLGKGMESGELRRMDPELAIQFFLGTTLQPVVGWIYGTVNGSPVGLHAEIMGALRRLLAVKANGTAA
ncbi:MAG: TetR/AcrR family transcriptional regulator [Planctomycetes bacterium]|nr:TetR/AcrR family transcriptional regulator [Planctomycetota bacterium]